MLTLNNTHLGLLTPELIDVFSSDQNHIEVAGGLPRGRLINVWGLVHSFKTGLINTILTQVAFADLGKKTRSGKRPAALVLLAEETPRNFYERLFKYITENQTGLPVASKSVPETVEHDVQALFANLGWDLCIKQLGVRQPITADQYLKYVGEVENDLTEVVVGMVDLPAFNAGKDLDKSIQDRNNALRLIAKARNQTILTTNVLSCSYREILKQDPQNFVQDAVSKIQTDSVGVLDMITSLRSIDSERGIELVVGCAQTDKVVQIPLHDVGTIQFTP